MASANTLCARIDAVRATIDRAAKQYGRRSEDVTLLAVSKTRTADEIRQAVACGQRAFGENYASELQEKSAVLADKALSWHFIGPVQSNKTRLIAERADWLHSLDRERIARRLNDQRPEQRPALNVCIQVNISDEPSKSGVAPEEILGLAEQIRALPRLRLRGLMAIPAPTDDPAQQRQAFAQLRACLEDLQTRGYELDTLSMGMSDDLEAAIAEGATIVRVGTAIFGSRSG
ncbi:YggS family pyridoxal phosphate-dependent enzyme [Ectothiorhodosinus mongolicus]|nr:YggS family pyridoxal phosphate-dependent enzyme [Ectothiorhodosinus mongolicus]